MTERTRDADFGNDRITPSVTDDASPRLAEVLFVDGTGTDLEVVPEEDGHGKTEYAGNDRCR